jgi:DNA mismatch repair protein MutS
VRREVVETITPGRLADALLDARRNNFLVALAGDPPGRAGGLALADLSTGELGSARCPGSGCRRAGRASTRRAAAPALLGAVPLPGAAAPCAPTAATGSSTRTAADELKRHFGVLNLEGFGFGRRTGRWSPPAARWSPTWARCSPRRARCARRGRARRRRDELDEMTRRNLELVEPLGAAAGGTLLGVLDEALTPMGGRLLRRWLLAPLVELDAIARGRTRSPSWSSDAELRRAVRDALARSATWSGSRSRSGRAVRTRASCSRWRASLARCPGCARRWPPAARCSASSGRARPAGRRCAS